VDEFQRHIQSINRNIQRIMQPYQNIRKMTLPHENLLKTSKHLQQLTRSHQNHSKMISPINNLSSGMTQALRAFNVNKLIPNETFKVFEEIKESVRKFGDSTEKFKTIMLELGYPPHGNLYPYEIITIVELYENNTDIDFVKREVSKLMLEKYDEEVLSEMLISWKNETWSNKRNHLLEEIIHCHNMKMYNMSVPVILAQIEGLIAEGFNHEGMMNGRKMREYLERLLYRKSQFSFDETVQNFYLNVVLVAFEHGKPINSFMSRNAIMHGADTNYGTAENSLKAILLLDHIHERITSYRKKEGIK
jgi:hypothetical protein